MNWKQFFQDGTGAFSAYRLIFIMTCAIILILITYLTIKDGAFPKIDGSCITIFEAIILGKVGQSISENFSSSTPSTTSTTLTTTTSVPTP